MNWMNSIVNLVERLRAGALSPTPAHRRGRLCARIGTSALLLGFLVSAQPTGAETYWKRAGGSAGKWETASNWSNGAPTSGNGARIGHNGGTGGGICN